MRIRMSDDEKGLAAGQLVIAEAHSKDNQKRKEIDQEEIFEKFIAFYKRLQARNKYSFQVPVAVQIAAQLVTAFVMSDNENEVFAKFYKFYEQLDGYLPKPSGQLYIG